MVREGSEQANLAIEETCEGVSKGLELSSSIPI
jgi:hypothetical protein